MHSVRIRQHAVEDGLFLFELLARHLEMHRAHHQMALWAIQPWRANAAGKISAGYLCGQCTWCTRARAGGVFERFGRAPQTLIALLFEARHAFAGCL